MKPSLIALFFLFAFIAASSAKAEFLRDTNGDFVVNGGAYYIAPFITVGGRLTLTKTGNETCPLSVTASSALIIIPPEIVYPWKISSPLRIGFIPTDTIVDFFTIEGKVPNCVTSPSKWTIVELEDGVKSVKISGYEDTLKGSFKIQKSFNGWSYRILFCPTNGDSCGAIWLSNGNRLAITDDYYVGFVFIKAESSQVSSEHVINNVLDA